MRPINVVCCRVLLLLCVCGWGCGDASESASQIRVIGFPTSRMNYHIAEQEASNWCWAACVQMALSARGIEVSQEEIIRNTFGGELRDEPGGPEEILANLNGNMKDRAGRTIHIWGSCQEGPPSLEQLRSQFNRGIPLIIGYDVPWQSVGHAAVVTAVIYRERDGGSEIVKVLVRDPSPAYRATLGKRELTPAEFRQIFVHYFVTSLEQ